MNSQITNINEARRAANSNTKAIEIIKEGYTFTDELGDGTLIAVTKPGRLAASYWITDGECDCPDFMKRGSYCKHILAYDIKQDEEEMMEALLRRMGSAPIAGSLKQRGIRKRLEPPSNLLPEVNRDRSNSQA